MTSLFSSNYLSRRPVEIAMKEFARNFDSKEKVLDIGCGRKPYAQYFNCHYIGLDPHAGVNPDIIANAWKIPALDNSFDGVILNQSLEHISETEKTILEIKRVLKPGGKCIVTVPQTMKNHSIPLPSREIKLNNFDKNKIRYWNVDYYRFTKFGLIYLFRDFKVLKIEETSGYFGTIFQLINYFFTSLKPLDKIFIPLFLVSNISGIILDNLFYKLSKIKGGRKFYDLIYTSLPLNYIMIAEKNKEYH